jgi:hypothetical protein
MSGVPRWLIAGTCKKSFLMDVKHLKYLSKYFCKERKCNDILEK